MKQDDFERLKAVCEKEGFDISKGSIGDIDGWFTIDKKRDPWQNVEFVECVDDNGSGEGSYTIGRIYPIKTVVGDTVQTTIDDSGDFNGWNKRFFKPSTEATYVDQLKKEAFERFGDIKEGDSFVTPNYVNVCVEFIEDKGYPKGLHYIKERDRFYFDNVLIYQQGKWAEKVKERVKVDLDYEHHGQNSSYYFISSGDLEEEKYKGSGQFLASQLEKYLNVEIE